jgi:cyclase
MRSTRPAAGCGPMDSTGSAQTMPPGVPGPDGQPRGPRVLAGILPSYTAGQIDASGGAGKLVHSYEAVEAGAMILLAASVFHFPDDRHSAPREWND